MNYSKTLDAIELLIQNLKSAKILDTIRHYSTIKVLLDELEGNLNLSQKRSHLKFTEQKKVLLQHLQCLCSLDIDPKKTLEELLSASLKIIENLRNLYGSGLFPAPNKGLIGKLKNQ